MKKVTRLGLMLSLAGIALSSCNKDKDDVMKPTPVNESEQITTMKLLFTKDQTINTTTFTWKDIDGARGAEPTIDTIRLEPSKSYKVRILLLDETTNPADTISDEVAEEGDEHQLFFTATGADVTIDPVEMDNNGVPVGLHSVWIAGVATADKNGKVKIVLKHQGDKKPKTGLGDENIGDTDIESAFPIIIK